MKKKRTSKPKRAGFFSLADLAAGSQIILALMDKLEVNNNHKKVFFTRDSQFAWPLGYLLDHVASSANQAPSAGH